MSVDEARGLVFIPTSSPSPDFYGGLRAGDNRYANSVVPWRWRRALYAGLFKPFTTMCGIMTCPRNLVL